MEEKANLYQIDYQNCLGQGVNSKVYAGIIKKTQKKIAIKIISKNELKSRTQVLSEVFFLKEIASFHLIQFVDFYQQTSFYYIIQELCQNTLANYLQAKKFFHQTETIEIMIDIMNGVFTLLRQGIIHRDLKPQNIMRVNGRYKICDLGEAARIKSLNTPNRSFVGTPYYMAPQKLYRKEYTSKSQIWSLGIIFYELIQGQKPWKASTEYDLIEKIECVPLQFTKPCHKDVENFIRRCLRINPEKRISWEQIYNHPIFKGKISVDLRDIDEIQTKFKVVMMELERCLCSYHLTSLISYKCIDSQLFHQYLLKLSVNITQQQSKVCFMRLDYNNDGKIYLYQLVQQIQKYFNKEEQIENEEENFLNSLKKFHFFLLKNKITLKSIFICFDEKRMGNLNSHQLYMLLSKFNGNISPEIVDKFFRKITSSKQLSFLCFNEYLSKEMGIGTCTHMPTLKKLLK